MKKEAYPSTENKNLMTAPGTVSVRHVSTCLLPPPTSRLAVLVGALTTYDLHRPHLELALQESWAPVGDRLHRRTDSFGLCVAETNETNNEW
jgi:hypothetical protein